MDKLFYLRNIRGEGKHLRRFLLRSNEIIKFKYILLLESIIKALKWKSTKCKLGAGRENRVSFLVLKRKDKRT